MSSNEENWKQILSQVKHTFEEQVPFNKLLGLKIDRLDLECVKVRIEKDDHHVGNFVHGILHGGVIAAVLDVTGGLTAFVSLLQKMGDASVQEKMERLAKFGTIDLRVDYLRPGKGKHFTAEGTILRTGKKIAVTRMELHNDTGHMIAVGTGTYLAV